MNEAKKDRKRPVYTIKPCTGHAPTQTGAGAHKDKKKADKQGESKHKKKDYAESLEDKLASALVEAGMPSTVVKMKQKLAIMTPEELLARKKQGIAEVKQRLDAKCWTGKHKEGTKIKGGVRVNNCVPNESVAEGGYDYHKPDPHWITIDGKRWKKTFNRVQAQKAVETLNAKFRTQGSNKHADYEPADPEEDPNWGIKISNEAMNGITGPGMMKDPTETMEPEGETLKNSLHTIIRVATHLDKRLDINDDFPEWVSEKMGAIKGMMVSVMDYLISTQEMEHDPDAMGEGISARDKWNKASSDRQAKHDKIEADTKSRHASGKEDMKGAINRLEKHVKKEGWTHDSLADQLFEHERTYEDKLQNQLNKLTKK